MKQTEFEVYSDGFRHGMLKSAEIAKLMHDQNADALAVSERLKANAIAKTAPAPREAEKT